MNNPSAFPLTESTHVDGEHYAHPGMTLRDYFAAAALPIMRSENLRKGDRRFSQTAKDAYDMADAMLKAREAVEDE